MINAIANPTMPEVGERYLGTVVKTTTFGAFVSLVPGRDGLLHISQAARAGRRQAGRQRRGRRQGRRQGAGRDRRDRPARQALADPGRRPTVRPRHRRAGSATPDVARRRPDARAADGTTHAPSTRVDGGGGLVRRTVLPGGLRIVTEAMPTVRSVDVRHLGRRRLPRRDPVARGRVPLPRAPAVQGHQAARRAGRSPSAIDAVGGEMNAFTSKEYTCFYARVLDDRPAAGGRRGLRPGHLAR